MHEVPSITPSSRCCFAANSSSATSARARRSWCQRSRHAPRIVRGLCRCGGARREHLRDVRQRRAEMDQGRRAHGRPLQGRGRSAQGRGHARVPAHAAVHQMAEGGARRRHARADGARPARRPRAADVAAGPQGSRDPRRRSAQAREDHARQRAAAPISASISANTRSYQYGNSESGHFDHWGAASCTPFRTRLGQRQGRVPAGRHHHPALQPVRADEIRLEIRDGFIRKIEGGLEAKLMSSGWTATRAGLTTWTAMRYPIWAGASIRTRAGTTWC